MRSNWTDQMWLKWQKEVILEEHREMQQQTRPLFNSPPGELSRRRQNDKMMMRRSMSRFRQFTGRGGVAD